MKEHNKEKTCQGCPDRCPEPNCHEKCEGYKHRQMKQARIKAERKKETEISAAKAEMVESVKKRTRNGTLRNHLRTK